jgi:hypothetical protein
VEDDEPPERRYPMSESWREVARLGKKGEKYPHILVDSHGWCLRLGPSDREDEKFYSSLPTMLQGLLEHLLRRKDHESPKAVLEMKDLLIQNLKEARDLGEELGRKFLNLRQRRLEARDLARVLKESGTPTPEPGIAAAATEAA